MKAKLIAITVGAAVLLTGLWYVALWSPQGDKIEKANAEQAAAEAKSAELTTRLQRLKRLEANKEQLDADLALFAELIPQTDELDDFILDIHARANQSGIDFMSIAPAEPALAGAPGTAAGGPVSVGLTMQAKGDYFALLRFLEQVRDGERLVTIDTLTLTGGADGGEVNASISGRMFIRGATPAPAAAAAAPATGGA